VPRARGRWLLVAALVALGGLAVAATVSTRWFASIGGRLAGERLDRARRSPQFRDGKFRNPIPTTTLVPGRFWRMMRHQFFGSEERVPKRTIPVERRTASDYSAAPAFGLRATWIGHASTLVEIDGRRVLTDPIWSERCSPTTLVGPKRFHPPPIPVEQLPPIDAVVISHDHYDHLDMATVQGLAARGTRFAVPLGVGAHLEKWGVDPATIVELDWNESASIAGLTLTATPARHYSGRNPLHGNETLWSSWVVAGPAHRFFFSGDSGYFDAYKAIAVKHGPFDLALIKIGACDEMWQAIHMSPEEAVQAARDLGARLLLPVHWGTFNLAFHAWNDPPERAVAAAQKAGVAIVVPRPGELVGAEQPQRVEAWWR
jgi:L-ascorbate metabolism protein UlaG (beta-lactamase superfamily)